MKIALILVTVILFSNAAYATQQADFVLVVKNQSRLYLMSKEKVFASFRVTFGSNPKGHKQQLGDQRTPEGRYILDYKNGSSRYYKAIHVSYPNAQDRANAKKRGVDPGGDIMIHGQANGWGWLSVVTQFINWTDGCIALSDSDMDVVWNAVQPGTPIEIRP